MATQDRQAADKKNIVKAEPTKDFFVRTITRDISLKDCIFDLLDNSIDGAHRRAAEIGGQAPYKGFEVRVDFTADKFVFADNCGGITLHDAINHAFHFGRKPDAPDVDGGIGLYGIGMKRAIFKIGSRCSVFSQAPDAAFRVDIDVHEWLKAKEWDFEYVDIPRRPGATGTLIEIERLYPAVQQSFGDSHFANNVIMDMARDYAFFIEKGLRVLVNGRAVPSYQYKLSQSDEVRPLVDTYVDEGVSVRILAGIAEPIPDDVPDDLRPDKTARLGWFVVCNDRVVLAADKSDDTVWGNGNFPVWHGQYSGFCGFVFFNSDDQNKLPWTTTKRNVELESQLYRRTLVKMKAVTAEFIRYSQLRKGALPEAKAAEASVQLVELRKLNSTQEFKLPVLRSATTKPGEVNILYKKPIEDVEAIKRSLNRIRMTARDVGSYTFDYYMRTELGKS
jgi:hypothetical protein